jgi:hypothetical protein
MRAVMSAVAAVSMALLTTGAASAGDSRVPERYELKLPNVPKTAYYYVMKPQGFDASKEYPLLIVIPGSHNPDGTVDENRGYAGVCFWAYQGTEKFITISLWYSNDIDAYPHWEKPNAITGTDLMIRDALARFPADKNRIFYQSFSAGGVLTKQMLDKYTKESPVKLAGIAFTDSNCRGGNQNVACIQDNTAVFIGVGEFDKPPSEPFDCVAESYSWESIFKARCKDLEHHVIPGQKHNPGAEQMELFKKWIARVLKQIDDREIAFAVQNLKNAQKALKKSDFGAALKLTEPSLKHDVKDNADFTEAKKIAEALTKHADALKKEYKDKIEKEPEGGVAALVAAGKVFKGSAVEEWAAKELMNLKTQKQYQSAISKATKNAKAVEDREKTAIKEELGLAETKPAK